MLSRVANLIYWTARYLERGENTLRLIDVNAQLVLDLESHDDFNDPPREKKSINGISTVISGVGTPTNTTVPARSRA